MIVKVEIPLYIRDNDATALVYDRGQTIIRRIPITMQLRVRMHGRLKLYFNAELVNDEIVLMDEILQPQNW